VAAYQKGATVKTSTPRSTRSSKLVDAWQAEAGVKTYGEAVADVMRFRATRACSSP
jgi:hypothetical protein